MTNFLQQRTLNNTIRATGVGLHTGEKVFVTLRPAPVDSGIVFVRTDLNPYEHVEILKTTGAVRLIGSARGPVPIADQTIDSLKIMVNGDHPVTTDHSLQKGDKVLVLHGPFAGVTGTFTRYGGKGRVIVNIDALGQYAGVEVSEDDIEIVPKILT